MQIFLDIFLLFLQYKIIYPIFYPIFDIYTKKIRHPSPNAEKSTSLPEPPIAISTTVLSILDITQVR